MGTGPETLAPSPRARCLCLQTWWALGGPGKAGGAQRAVPRLARYRDCNQQASCHPSPPTPPGRLWFPGSRGFLTASLGGVECCRPEKTLETLVPKRKHNGTSAHLGRDTEVVACKPVHFLDFLTIKGHCSVSLGDTPCRSFHLFSPSAVLGWFLPRQQPRESQVFWRWQWRCEVQRCRKEF